MKSQGWLIKFYQNVFNIWYALISLFANGAIAMWVNAQFGPEQFIWAGIAQGISSFFSTGVTARVIQHFSPIEPALKSYLLGSLVPATMTLIISLTAHLLNGTPRVLASCIAPVLISFSTSFVTNWITRHGWLLPSNYPREKIAPDT